MSIWLDCEPTAENVEEMLRREILEAKTLEEWNYISLNGKLSKCRNMEEVYDLWLERGKTIKRELIGAIKTPEDGFALHLRLKAMRSYSKDIQEELADKIRDVVAKWHPESLVGESVTMF